MPALLSLHAPFFHAYINALQVDSAPKGSLFNEEIYTIKNGLPVTGWTIASTARVFATGHSPVTIHLSAS
jgi:hypothetical protein